MSDESLEADPFDDASAAVICGWIYKKYGEKGLREALLSMKETSKREIFRDVVEELRGVRLHTPASIVAEVTETFPSALDQRFCPHKPGEPGYEIWWKLERKWLERYERERPERLKRRR